MLLVPPRARTFFLALSAALLLANARTLRGELVYDDQILPDHPLLDGWDDVLGAFVHTSEDYLGTVAGATPTAAHGVTYRPLPMVSFAIVNAGVGPMPFAHHAVSLAFHLLVVYLLVRLARDGERLAWSAAFAIATWAAHPALVEAYGWINGRSDVMACAALAGVALVLRERRIHGGRLPALVAILLAGTACKETFLVAAFFVLVASALEGRRDRPLLDGRALAPFVAYGTAAVLFFATRRALLPHAIAGSGIPWKALGHEARIVALGVETLVWPAPRAMRLLAWEVSRSWSPIDAASLAFAILAAVFFAARRKGAALALVLGAIVTLMPASLVSDGFWLGFDRYLYMPSCLVLLAFLGRPASILEWPLRRVAGASTVVVALLSLTFLTGRAYASQQAFYERMIETRPHDPTGYLVGVASAAARGDLHEARRLAAASPTADLPPVLLHRSILVDLMLDRIDAAAALVADANARFPDDPRFVLDALRVRGELGDWDAVLRMLRSIRDRHPSRFASAVAYVEAWLAASRVPPDMREPLRRAIAEARSGGAPKPL